VRAQCVRKGGDLVVELPRLAVDPVNEFKQLLCVAGSMPKYFRGDGDGGDAVLCVVREFAERTVRHRVGCRRVWCHTQNALEVSSKACVLGVGAHALTPSFPLL
jgi:hypothetical protein